MAKRRKDDGLEGFVDALVFHRQLMESVAGGNPDVPGIWKELQDGVSDSLEKRITEINVARRAERKRGE